MKKLLLSTFAASALLLAGCGQSEEVASTEAGRIREDDLYEAMKEEPLQSGMTVGETVLQKLLMEDIFSHLYGDQVSDEDIQAEYEASAEQFGGVENYEELLQMQGMDPEYIKDNMRLTLLIREAVRDNVEIPEEEVEALYEEQRPDYTAQHILVEDAETANEVIAQLEDGADFGELVTEYSNDPGSVETEGTYTFNQGEMVPEFEEAVENLEEGETTSEPVESDHGFHVIRRLPLEYAPLEEQREDLETQIVDSYINDQQFMSQLVTEMAQEANVQIADEDLQGAMAAYMPQEETPAEGEAPAEEESGESEGEEAPAEDTEEESTEEEATEEAPADEENTESDADSGE